MPTAHTTPRRRSLATVLTALALLIGAAAPSTHALDTDRIDAAVAAEMAAQNIVGVSIGVIRNGRVAYVAGYGLADLETQTPADRETVYNWASCSKPLMAVAAMQLVEEGKLDLDAGVHTYLPGLPAHLAGVTPRHLLCHQSGLPHYANGPVVPDPDPIAPGQALDPAHCLRRFIRSPLVFAPGTRAEYSSYAYVLLSAVVQAASGQPILLQLADRIETPLKLTSFQLDVPSSGQPHWATGYRLVAGVPTALPDESQAWKQGAGGYKSNVEDFAGFAVALMNHRLIEPATSNQMWTPQTTAAGEPTKYGLGVLVSGQGSTLKISHSGSQHEASSRMVLYPNQRHGIVVLCNTHGAEPGRISTAIYRAMRTR